MTNVVEIDSQEDLITMTTGACGEMLRVTKTGFYVRGVKVAQDEKEAEHVYNAFHQWLTWAALTRNY